MLAILDLLVIVIWLVSGRLVLLSAVLPYLQFDQGHHEEDDEAGVHDHGDLGHVHRDPGGEQGDRGVVVSDLLMYCRSVPISSSTGAAKAQVMKNAITPVEDGGWRMKDGGWRIKYR